MLSSFCSLFSYSFILHDFVLPLTDTYWKCFGLHDRTNKTSRLLKKSRKERKSLACTHRLFAGRRHVKTTAFRRVVRHVCCSGEKNLYFKGMTVIDVASECGVVAPCLACGIRSMNKSLTSSQKSLTPPPLHPHHHLCLACCLPPRWQRRQQ